MIALLFIARVIIQVIFTTTPYMEQWSAEEVSENRIIDLVFLLFCIVIVIAIIYFLVDRVWHKIIIKDDIIIDERPFRKKRFLRSDISYYVVESIDEYNDSLGFSSNFSTKKLQLLNEQKVVVGVIDVSGIESSDVQKLLSILNTNKEDSKQNTAESAT